MRVWRAAAVLVAMAILPVAAVAEQAQTKTETAAQAVGQAREALQANRPADAVRLADTVLVQMPANREAVDVKIRALLALRDRARARAAYDDFVTSAKKQDGGLLRPLAADELRDVAATAGSDVQLRVTALDRLAAGGDAAAAADLERMAAEGAGVGMLADSALAKRGDAGAVRRLADAASSARIRDKSLVARAIQSANAKGAAYALVPLLQDPSPVVRSAAADALGALGYQAAAPELRALLSDQNGAARIRAALALKRLGDSAGDDLVAALLKGPAVDGRLDALEVSPGVKPADRSAIIKAALADGDPGNRIRAAELLARDDPAAARAVLTPLLKSGDPFSRIEAGRALDALGSPDLAVLHSMLADRNGWVRAYAAGGVLTATGTPSAGGTRKGGRR